RAAGRSWSRPWNTCRRTRRPRRRPTCCGRGRTWPAASSGRRGGCWKRRPPGPRGAWGRACTRATSSCRKAATGRPPRGRRGAAGGGRGDVGAGAPGRARARHTRRLLRQRLGGEPAAPPAAADPTAVVPAAAGAARPRVSLCMIVKDEEANLPACLGSVADLVDEVVVVDTGSADRTREVAARYGAKVYDFAWVDSFAAARNESLRHATGDWVLWLDADGRLDAGNR